MGEKVHRITKIENLQFRFLSLSHDQRCMYRRKGQHFLSRMRSLLFLLGLCLLPTLAPAAITLPGDLDGDGLLNEEEDINTNSILDAGETNPLDADTDGGGEADGAEVRAGRDPLDPIDDLTADPDKDGLNNAREQSLGTNPRKADSDGDGLPDGQEVALGINPLSADTDQDGLLDGEEQAIGTGVKNPDSDGDGLNDGADPFPLEKAFTKDTDADGIPDEWEQSYDLSPQEHQDGLLDSDNDGLSNADEFRYGTDPRQADTDHDGVPDGVEVADGADPAVHACLLYMETANPLTDMDGHWSASFVRHLQRTQAFSTRTPIVEGYVIEETGERFFLPDIHISRYELLKIALLSTCTEPGQEDASQTLPFTDLPFPEHLETADQKMRHRILSAAHRLRIIQGYPDGTFRPHDPVNRAEALKILLRAARFTVWADEERVPTPFSDVPPDSWFTPYVEQAYGLQFVEGYPDPEGDPSGRLFRPDQSVTRAEAAKLVYYILISNPNVNSEVIPTGSSPSESDTDRAG